MRHPWARSTTGRDPGPGLRWHFFAHSHLPWHFTSFRLLYFCRDIGRRRLRQDRRLDAVPRRPLREPPGSGAGAPGAGAGARGDVRGSTADRIGAGGRGLGKKRDFPHSHGSSSVFPPHTHLPCLGAGLEPVAAPVPSQFHRGSPELKELSFLPRKGGGGGARGCGQLAGIAAGRARGAGSGTGLRSPQRPGKTCSTAGRRGSITPSPALRGGIMLVFVGFCNKMTAPSS